MNSPILGSSYVARSVNAADSRMVNLFPEIVPEGSDSAGFLTRAPGLTFLASMGTGPIRGLWTQTNADVFYVVSGQNVYSMDATDATPELIGTMTGTGTDPVSIDDNGTEVFFAAGGLGYIWNTSTTTFAEVTDADFPGSSMVAFLDGYFAVNEPGSQKIYVSDIYNGMSWNPLAFASAEGSPDGVVAIASIHKELWVFGAKTIEVWYDAATDPFPFAPIQGAFIETGCAAPYSVAKLDNTLFWLGSDARGQGIVYKANGYSPQRISTHAVEWQIQQYSTLTDAVAYTYQQEGHSFYVLNFPTVGTTWVYDVSTGAWHERASYENNQLTRHRSNCQCNFQGHIVVGDWKNGNIYELDTNSYSDSIGPQKWIRSWRALPKGANDLRRTTNHALQIQCESGVGLGDGQGADPQMMLRWSDDGGHTWSDYSYRPMGKIGEYYRRVIWYRLGITTKLRDRVYEISGSDPVKIAITDAELLLSPTRV